MTANPYQNVAKEFMDLWQKQMSSVMGDKQFIHAMLELFQNMQATPNAKTTAAASNPANPPATEPGLLTELAFRLAMCEKRLAALEAEKPAASGKSRDGKRTVAKRDPAGSKKPNK